jgi:hypothetical protein
MIFSVLFAVFRRAPLLQDRCYRTTAAGTCHSRYILQYHYD